MKYRVLGRTGVQAELRAEISALSRTPPPATDRLEEIKPEGEKDR